MKKEGYTEHRPWGYFKILEIGDTYKVKKLVINSGHRLSLQLHKKRDEQWIIVQGKPTIKRGDDIKEYSIGQNVEIRRETLHRVENNHKEPVIIIEVQNGEYLGEDDIIRIEDDYLRTNS
ncbi:MAG: phosphomannose isomerase type II C-terminal cupin domain [Desulfosudis oleivorans]|nr:phosphomannose isomerase type II C-terminal cupin domain [Desulfosudis oleivorans]